MDIIQTPEKVFYFQDCLDRVKRLKEKRIKRVKEKKNKPAIRATKYILTILRMCPSGLLFFNHLVYCGYRNCSENSSFRVTVQKIKVLWPSWRTKPVKITHKKHQGGKCGKQIEEQQITGNNRLACLMNHMDWQDDKKRGKIVQILQTC